MASLEASNVPVVQAADIAKVLGANSAAPASSPVAAAPAAVRMSLLGVAMAGKRRGKGQDGTHPALGA